MALSYNLGYQESISVHPTRRQNFAGKVYSNFPNIWEWLVHTSEEDRSQIFYASLLILYVRPSLSNTWMDWFAFFQPGRKFFENSKLVSRCLTIVSKPGQSSFKVVNTLQKMRIDFYVFHWSWYSIQFDCTIPSLIHIWRENRVLICWHFFRLFYTDETCTLELFLQCTKFWMEENVIE